MRRAGSAFVGVGASLAFVSSGTAAESSFCEMLVVVVAWRGCFEQVRKYVLSAVVRLSLEFHVHIYMQKYHQNETASFQIFNGSALEKLKLIV